MLFRCRRGAARGAGEADEHPGPAVQHALEVSGDAHRPRQRCGPQADAFVDLVHQLQGVSPRPVPLVDDGDDRDAPVLADLEQFQGLRLETLGGVDEHHRAVHRGQHPVGVFGEVGVPGRVEQVDDTVPVRELQRRRRDRDASGLLHLHPVRHGRATSGLAVDGAGLGDHPRMQGQCLGQRRFTGVGMADHGEGAAALRFGGDAGGGAVTAAGGGRRGGVEGRVGHVRGNGMADSVSIRNRAASRAPGARFDLHRHPRVGCHVGVCWPCGHRSPRVPAGRRGRAEVHAGPAPGSPRDPPE